MKKIQFTVLMAVYGGDDPSLFHKALNSVFANSRKPDSVILVVDGPVPEGINRVIDTYRRESSMVVVPLPCNVGLANALNVGLSQVRTEWVVRADADDFNHADRFEILCNTLNDDVDLIGSSISEVENNGDVICERRLPLKHEEIIEFMRRRNPFNHMTVAFRVDLARKCGGYPLLHLREDYALWIRMCSQGARMRNLSKILVDATTGRGMYERRGGWHYARGEWALQRLLVNEGIKSTPLAMIDLILRSSIFLAPRGLRRIIYEKLLRNRRIKN